jgi:hypothetical protein
MGPWHRIHQPRLLIDPQCIAAAGGQGGVSVLDVEASAVACSVVVEGGVRSVTKPG